MIKAIIKVTYFKHIRPHLDRLFDKSAVKSLTILEEGANKPEHNESVCIKSNYILLEVKADSVRIINDVKRRLSPCRFRKGSVKVVSMVKED